MKYRILVILSGSALAVVAFTYSVYKLWKSLKKFKGEEFKKEIKSIKLQCTGFYATGLLYFVFFSLEFAITDIAVDDGKLSKSEFNLLIATGIFLLLSNFVPSFYYMYVHHRIFSETLQTIINNKQSEDPFSSYETYLRQSEFDLLRSLDGTKSVIPIRTFSYSDSKTLQSDSIMTIKSDEKLIDYKQLKKHSNSFDGKERFL